MCRAVALGLDSAGGVRSGCGFRVGRPRKAKKRLRGETLNAGAKERHGVSSMGTVGATSRIPGIAQSRSRAEERIAMPLLRLGMGSEAVRCPCVPFKVDSRPQVRPKPASHLCSFGALPVVLAVLKGNGRTEGMPIVAGGCSVKPLVVDKHPARRARHHHMELCRQRVHEPPHLPMGKH